MCSDCPKSDLTLLKAVFDECGTDAGSLITVLQHAQEIYGWLPVDVMYEIAERLGVSPARVIGVSTFYTQFRLTPVGKHLIMLCKGTACHVNGADAVEKAICGELKIKDGETTPDGLFSLKTVACLGCCSLSPVMMVDEDVFGSLTPSTAVEALRKIKERENE